ncbi:MAG: tRNA 2-selenouridine(34) synthase MnmH [Sulfurospirillum sp.]|nr:tRNA 2-selenouridine(34) synthase MnmH [Sulfurospirillum sp.]
MLKTISIEQFMAQKSHYALIIDARSPKEYNESKIPNAHNYFALSDDEHHEVGTVYKQNSKSKAKIIGASYICQNASKHIKKIYETCPIGSKIAVYCARGGLRSTSIGTILSLSGYRIEKIDRGYKDYRKFVLAYLENFPHKKFITLGGNTGCGKSELLQKLEPALDIEALANHFGSTFGSILGEQPNQKEFQNNICEKLMSINTNAWIFVEGESKKLGKIIQPDRLYAKIHDSIRIEVTAPLHQRVVRILKDYVDIDESFFLQSMQTITPYIKKEAKIEAIEAFYKQDLAKVAEILLVQYYDKVYKKPQKIDFSIDTGNMQAALENLQAIHTELSNIS